MSLRTDRIRVVSFVKKKDDLSQEEFHRYWLEEHSKVFSSIAIAKRNLLKYEQMHKDHHVCKALDSLGFLPPHWDGLALFEAESFEKFFAIFEDEEYKKIVVPDELKFIDRPKCTLLPLNLATIYDRD